MKKILLIGDSIRMGYDKYVKSSMRDVAEVYFPQVNCTFTTYILRFLHTWTDDLNLFDADAVHWNAGLWDSLKIYGDGNLVSKKTYAENVERIYKRIKFLFPNAVQIFATSTPVMEDGYIQGFETRTNADVEKYNEIAVKVLKKHGVIIDDLFSLLKDCHEEYHSDQTHFYTVEGTKLIGDKVNSVLCDALKIDKSQLKTPEEKDFTLIEALSDKEYYEKHGNVYVKKRQ